VRGGNAGWRHVLTNARGACAGGEIIDESADHAEPPADVGGRAAFPAARITAQDSPIPPGIHDGFQEQIPQVYGQTYPATAYQGCPGASGGQIRTSLAVFLFTITLGSYGLVWYDQVHDEMRRHSGQGLGGGVSLLIAFFVAFVSPFLVSAEVGQLYQRRDLQRPVGSATGLWRLLAMFILIGPIIWFVKTNNALNANWRSLGVR
jgi:hypothetical protein